MITPEEFEQQFNASYASLLQLLQLTKQPLLDPVRDVLSLTVGAYLGVVDASEQALRDIPVETLTSLYTFIQQRTDPASFAIVEALIAQDYDTAFQSLNNGRAVFNDAQSQQIVGAFLLDPTDGLIRPDLINLLAGYQQDLDGLLWQGDASQFLSPEIAVDGTTGSWTAVDGSGGSVAGSSQSDLYQQIGESIAKISALAAIPDVTVVPDSISGADVETMVEQAGVFATQMAGLLFAIAEEPEPNDVLLAEGVLTELVDDFQQQFSSFSPSLDALTLGLMTDPFQFTFSPVGAANPMGREAVFVLTSDADGYAGGPLTDIVYGMDGNDVIDGNAGADLLIGGFGNDTLNGGAGDADMAVFSAPMDRFTLQFAANGEVAVRDRDIAGTGTDLISEIEVLAFNEGASIFEDGLLNLSLLSGAATLDAQEIDTLVELYIAYFNRAPDALGLYFWGNAFANGMALDTIANLFLDQDETRALYPDTLTNFDFASTVYSNVLGRVADPAGLEFWQRQLDTNTVSRGEFILEVLKGAKADPFDDATPEFIELQMADRDYLSQKADIGTYFAVINGLSNVTDAADAMQLFIRGDATSINAAVAQIDADFTAADQSDSGQMILQLVGIVADPFEGF